jgi:outer membrane protein assembly factor BamB
LHSSQEGAFSQRSVEDEETKSLGPQYDNENNLSSVDLPNVWQEPKKGQAIFGGPSKDSPGKKKILTGSEIEMLLKSHCKTMQKISISNWTCPFVSCGGFYNSGFIFSRGKGNKLHVLNAETLQTEVVRETAGHGLFCCRVYNDLAWVGCYDGHLFVFDVNTFEKKD